MTKGEKFLQDLGAYKAKGDWDAMLKDYYHDDAEVLAFGSMLKGKEAIKAHFVEGPKRTGKVLGMSLDYFAESDDVVIYKGTIKTEFGTIKADEAFYLKDGKILRHIALTIPSDKTTEWALKDL